MSGGIALVDYGVGNLGSIVNMLSRLRIPVKRVSDREGLTAADRIILPGVGAFDTAMQRLNEKDLVGPLSEQVLERRKPCLGICLGMQLMGKGSEEGSLPGLGWIDATARRLDLQPPAKVPHMGWAYVRACKTHPLVDPVHPDTRFYFVHSYHVVCNTPADRLLEASYGGVWFTAAVQRNNVAAMQFHPEKSHRYGMDMLAAFAAWQPGMRRHE